MSLINEFFNIIMNIFEILIKWTIYNNINFILNTLNNIVYIVIKREDYIILFTLIIYKILYLKLFKKLFYFFKIQK